ncbi:hypothetical protein, variant [Blastomyces gilchristii SLH14081]|uniref:DUF6891 domain-containing protein n=1 Tax=Blastomyces gilchristii (strain SLH14081) TaxID=559298 RepID=A0A179UA29_BLAGS|nr:hypothetical protein, variant [Blastomyces gilchristii SLH14081]OAT04149.1 hypothetical protein, variant [Blastomyces gilchristii SLH14081]
MPHATSSPPTTTEPTPIDEDAIDNVKAGAAGIISTAAYTKAELLDQITYLFHHERYDSNDPRIIAESRRIIDELWQARLEQQATWPADADAGFQRVKRAFEILAASKGILTRMNFCYTAQSGDAQIHREARVGDSGWAYFHMQDAERAVDGGGLCVRYGALSDVDAETAEVGKTVVQVLRDAGLRVVWNGRPQMVIRVTPLSWRPRLLVEE